MKSDINESGFLDDDSEESLFEFLEPIDKLKPAIEDQTFKSFELEPQTGNDKSCSEAVFSDTNIDYSYYQEAAPCGA